MVKKLITIQTERLILRPWEEEDLESFAKLNADPRVMEYFPSVLTREQSDRQAYCLMNYLQKHGWGFWAVERIACRNPTSSGVGQDKLYDNAVSGGRISSLQVGVLQAPNAAKFIGFIGLEKVDFSAHFTPSVEIGWRLAFDYWGHGYATEGARASLVYGFETLQLKEIVSFTAIGNKRSQRVMEKIGMHHSPADDFDHPRLPADCKVRRHVLYRIRRDEWEHIPPNI